MENGVQSTYGWGAGSGYRTDGFGPTGGAALQKVGARYYDPEFGCFLTRDTDLGQKPYVYCDGDPVNCTDPSGHKGSWWQNLLKGIGTYFTSKISFSYKGGSTTTTTSTYTNNDKYINGKGGGQQLNQTSSKSSTTKNGPSWSLDLK